MLFDTVTVIAASALSLRYVLIAGRAAYIQRWMKYEREINSRYALQADASGRPHLIFVVPALDEQDTLPRALESIRAAMEDSTYTAEVIIVTTERERWTRSVALNALNGAKDNLPGKIEKLIRRLAINPERLKVAAEQLVHSTPPVAQVTDKIISLVQAFPYTWDVAGSTQTVDIRTQWVHDSYECGNMASQLNVALQHLTDDSALDRRRSYFVVFNADSIASPESVARLGDLLIRDGLPNAAQLMAVPLLNCTRMWGKAASAYLIGASIYQTRWTLGYEFNMLTRAEQQLFPSFQRLYRYCRGHGMAFRLDYLVTSGGFEPTVPLEDLFQGYMLSLRGSTFHAVPVIEWTEHPQTVAALLSQKAFWYLGMLRSLSFGKLAKLHGVPEPSRLRIMVFLAISLYREVGTWLLGPTVVIAFTVWCIWSGHIILATLPLLNATITTALVTAIAPDRVLGDVNRVWYCCRFVMAVFGVLAYSMTRNAGPCLALIKVMIERASNVRNYATVP